MYSHVYINSAHVHIYTGKKKVTDLLPSAVLNGWEKIWNYLFHREIDAIFAKEPS